MEVQFLLSSISDVGEKVIEVWGGLKIDLSVVRIH